MKKLPLIGLLLVALAVLSWAGSGAWDEYKTKRRIEASRGRTWALADCLVRSSSPAQLSLMLAAPPDHGLTRELSHACGEPLPDLGPLYERLRYVAQPGQLHVESMP